MNIFWLIALLGSLVGGLIMVVTLSSSNGAPQEAAGAAIAVGFAVIPYCFARCLQLWKHSTSGMNAFWGAIRSPHTEDTTRAKVSRRFWDRRP